MPFKMDERDLRTFEPAITKCFVDAVLSEHFGQRGGELFCRINMVSSIGGRELAVGAEGIQPSGYVVASV